MDILADLTAEHAALDRVVAELPEESWLAPTPAAGWDVRDTVSHLLYFDETATLAITDPDAFEVHKQDLIAATSAGAVPDVEVGRALSGPGVLARWRSSRESYVNAARAAGPARVPWYGPAMSITSFSTARLMETWAHGQDIRDALDSPAEASSRLRHVIHLGFHARPYAFAVHGVDDPGEPIRVEARAPNGDTWTWGPDDADNRVTGEALDLALVLTQRRHRSRTDVRVEGATAEAWMAIAQAFAGPATTTDPTR